MSTLPWLLDANGFGPNSWSNCRNPTWVCWQCKGWQNSWGMLLFCPTQTRNSGSSWACGQRRAKSIEDTDRGGGSKSLLKALAVLCPTDTDQLQEVLHASEIEEIGVSWSCATEHRAGSLLQAAPDESSLWHGARWSIAAMFFLQTIVPSTTEHLALQLVSDSFKNQNTQQLLAKPRMKTTGRHCVQGFYNPSIGLQFESRYYCVGSTVDATRFWSISLLVLCISFLPAGKAHFGILSCPGTGSFRSQLLQYGKELCLMQFRCHRWLNDRFCVAHKCSHPVIQDWNSCVIAVSFLPDRLPTSSLNFLTKYVSSLSS